MSKLQRGSCAHEQTDAPACKTQNRPGYNEALKRRGALTIGFDPAMTWQAAPTGQRGRQPDYSDAAIQICGGSENSPGDCFPDDWPDDKGAVRPGLAPE